MLTSRTPVGPYSVRFGGFLRWSRQTLHLLPDKVRHEQGETAREFGYDEIAAIAVSRGTRRLAIGDGPFIVRAWWIELGTRAGEVVRVPLHRLHYWDTAVVSVLLAAKAPVEAQSKEFALLAKSSEELLKQPPGAKRPAPTSAPFPSPMRMPPGRLR